MTDPDQIPEPLLAEWVALHRRIAELEAAELQRRQTETALGQSQEQLALFHRLGQRLAESLELYDVAQRALDDVCAVVGALRGVLLVREPDGHHLQVVDVSGYDDESVKALDRRVRLQIGDGLAGWVAAHRQSAVVADVTQDGRWQPVAGIDDWVRSALSVPLVNRDELVGVLSVYDEQESFYQDDHRRLIESVAAAVAAAVATARLYQQAQQRLQGLTNLNRASLAVISSLDLDEVLAQIVDLTSSVVHSDYTSVVLVDARDQPELG
ncbi:MAG: GAF domain-containing protein, partial [Chloroflexi bacterium]|nr:GAF domain-containing protein [Chloroflexota bacterium]